MKTLNAIYNDPEATRMTKWPYYEVFSYENPEQRLKWTALCNLYKEIDIFYYPEYSYAFELKGDGKACCFAYYESPTDIVLYPFLKRKINQLPNFANIEDDICDITSPYGYGGYLPSSNQIDMGRFFKIFGEYCRENNIVSEFVRFNPLLKNHLYYQDHGSIELWNETVYIDLCNDEETIWKGIDRSCRQAIRKAIKNDVSVYHDADLKHIDIFYELYISTMTRVGADSYYFFPKSWFENMAQYLNKHIVLLHAVHNGEIIASFFNLYNDSGNMYAFLGASNSAMVDLRPNNLIHFKGAMQAKDMGMKQYHLGGGLQPNDSLFRFKALFSSLRAPFYLGKIVHDQERYQDLCTQRHLGAMEDNGQRKFFPYYRAA